MLKLSVFMSPTGGHVGGWRHSDADTDAGYNIDRWVDYARLAERGKLDMLFLADGNGVNGIDNPALLERNPTTRPVVIEPLCLHSAIAMETSRIGLVATATTSFEQPFSVARRYAALDWISKGRAGWNVVTSSNPDDAKNFSRNEHADPADRYAMATEFVDVVKGLWDSWDDDAFVKDKASGRFLDAEKVRKLDHAGEYFSVRGPLNSARPPQGHPVVVVATGSSDGYELAARTADILFTVAETKEAAQEAYADVKARMAKYGRAPEDLIVMPGAAVFVAASEGDADAQYRTLQELIPDSVGMPTLGRICGLDLAGASPDDPLPELPATKGITSFRNLVEIMARRDNLSMRELYRRILPARGHALMKGSAAQIAETMGEWHRDEACDGFNLVAPYLPGGLEQVVDVLVPELQRRGLFRIDYEGATLRESLGLTRPSNRFANAG